VLALIMSPTIPEKIFPLTLQKIALY